ncbi:MAG TPA: fibronectin type III domain-containing protein [Cyclobacteriaceae bacterium]|nr:fibronectin type III domain-containing protein [Cyclobacteriaceae bacterium]
MKQLVLTGFVLLSALVAFGQNINRIEYFVDVDPGYGNATSVSFTAASTVDDLTFNVPVSSLSDGFHKLFIRTRDVNSKWSIGHYRAFYKIPASVVAIPNLTRIEYYIDTDPGYGIATNVPFTAGSSVTDLVFTVNVSSLSQTLHKLWIRAKDANNKWTVIQVKEFSVCHAPPTVAAAASAITATSFTANWSEVSGAIGYQLDVSADNFATFVSGYNSKGVTGTSSVVTGLTNGTAYKYRVRTVVACPSLPSNVISVSTTIPAPSAPGATAATAVSSTGFTANWNTVATATSYQLDVSPDNFATFVTGYDSKSVSTTSEIITGLTPGVLYRYRVRAVNAGGSSSNSNVIQATTPRESQTITFDAFPPKTFGDEPLTLAATASSGLAVTYSSSDPGVAQVIGGNRLFLKAPGTATITASQSGNATFVAATPNPQSITIGDASLTLSRYPAAGSSSFVPGQPFEITFSEDVVTTLTGNIYLRDGSDQVIESISAGQTNYFFVDRKKLQFSFNHQFVGGTTYKITTDDNFVLSQQHLAIQPANLHISFPAGNAGTIAFNPSTKYSVVGEIYYATPNDACAAITNGASSKIALIDRGGCNFVDKVINAGNAQASAAIIANNVVDPLNIGGSPVQSIPSAVISMADGATLKAAMSATQYGHIYNIPARAITGESWTFTVGSGTTPPIAPLATTATNISDVGFTAHWDGVAGATGYLLDVSADDFVTFVAGYNSRSVTTNSEAVTGLNSNAVYKYRVRASNVNGTSANSNVISVTTTASSSKQNQTITFNAIADKTLGDAPFSLNATASSSLPVSYSVTSDKVTISGSQVTLVKAGRVTIAANQAGNNSFNAAAAVSQSFCIKPARPTVTTANTNTDAVTLTSSATTGNQWFKDGASINGATNATYTATTQGVYKVQVKADDCLSEFSTDVSLIITGDLLQAAKVQLFPNPADDHINIIGLKGRVGKAYMIDMLGRSITADLTKTEGETYRLSVRDMSSGLYMLKVRDENAVHEFKFIKR